MTQMRLIDTQTLIYAFDPTNQEKHLVDAAKEKMNTWLTSPDIRLAITPLIRFELLKSGKLNEKRIKHLERALSQFEEFEIGNAEATLAASIFRYAEQTERKLERNKFDVFHFASAIINRLEIDSTDGDMKKIREVYDAQLAAV